MTLHIVGDSHAINGWKFSLPNLQINCNELGPFTMSRFGLEKLNLLNITAKGVNEGDVVCFSFGEIDCRMHLTKPQNFKIYKELVEELVIRYFEAIKMNVDQYKNLITLVFNIVPTSRIEQLQNYNNSDFPHLGSNEERKIIRLYMNRKLKEYCEKYNYIFLDVYDKYCDKEGFLDPELSDKYAVHIGNPIYTKEELMRLQLI